MSRNTVKRTIDLSALPPLTPEQQADLATLAELADGDIDRSDIPSIAESLWAGASQGHFYKPTKTSTTVRIDSDVLAWLRSQGPKYQTRINKILRQAMLAALDTGRR